MVTRIQYTFRNIKRNKLNSVITTVGLSIALASVLIIYLFVQQEKSYNSFHTNADKIYRLNYNVILKDGSEGASHLVRKDLPEVLVDKVPQIAHCTPFRIGSMAQLDLEEKNLKIRLGIAEQDFIKMFSFKLLQGKEDELLTNPTNVVLTRSLATKLKKNDSENFDELIGESVKFTFIPDTWFTIVGILDDLPKNSTIDFEALIPYEYEDEFWQSNNGFGNSTLFYELKDGIDHGQANSLIAEVVKEYYKKDIERGQKDNFLHPSSRCFEPYMIPLKNLYLDNSVHAAYELNGNKTQLHILSIVGALILFIAFANYIILTIGQFFKKAGEVSIRKSIGGQNIDILKMFLSENFVIISASFILGALLCYILIPVFNTISEGQIYFHLVKTTPLLVFSLFLIILLISLTSITPVLIFGKVKPTLLAAKKLFSGRKAGASQVFVSLQYALTIILIISTVIINKQTHHLKNQSLGFSEENIISLHVTYVGQAKAAILRDILQKEAGVINASLTNRNFFDGYSSCSFEVSSSAVMQTYIFKADNHFIPTLDLKLLEGRNFTESDINPDSKCIIVNEEFVKKIGFRDSPVDEVVKGCGDIYRIIGVVNDYQFLTSREKILPMVLYSNLNRGNSYSSILLKYNPRELSNVISAIKKGWKEIDTKEDLNYVFWDQELENRYNAEERLSKIIMYASIIAIIVLTLGLFGLSVLISEQRTNEIGIRKVNGAKIKEVIVLLNGDYLKWVFIAFLIACPSASYILQKWLDSFAFKTDLSWWVFVVSGIAACIIALLTVTYHSWRTATRNPVEALRYE